MTPHEWQTVKRVMTDALELAPAERAQFLARLEERNAELHGEVVSLIDADAAHPQFLETPDSDADPDLEDPAPDAFVGRGAQAVRGYPLCGVLRTPGLALLALGRGA